MPELRLHAVSFLDLYLIEGTSLRKVWAEAGHLVTPTPRAVLAARIRAPRSPIHEVLAALEAEGFAFNESEFRSEIDAGLAELGDAWRALARRAVDEAFAHRWQLPPPSPEALELGRLHREAEREIEAAREARKRARAAARRRARGVPERGSRDHSRMDPTMVETARCAWEAIFESMADQRAYDYLKPETIFDAVGDDDLDAVPGLHHLVEDSMSVALQTAGTGLTWRERIELQKAGLARRSPRGTNTTTPSRPRVTSAQGS